MADEYVDLKTEDRPDPRPPLTNPTLLAIDHSAKIRAVRRSLDEQHDILEDPTLDPSEKVARLLTRSFEARTDAATLAANFEALRMAERRWSRAEQSQDMGVR